MRRWSATDSPDSRGCSLGPGPTCGAPEDGGAATAGAVDAHGHPAEHVHRPGVPHVHQDHAREIGRRGLMVVLLLTAGFMVVEVVGGFLAHSLTLLADAGHMLTDVASLGLSLLAIAFARRPATAEKTFGYLRLEILAALVNGAALFVISVLIFIEAVRRFSRPPEVHGALMLAVGTAGLAVNVLAAWLLHRSAGHSLNVRGAYLHVLGDLLGSVGAMAAAGVILLTGWMLADPIFSIVVGVLVLYSAGKLVHESVDVLLEAVPAHIDLAEVRRALDEIPGLRDVHDLHVWTLTSGFLAMSGHAVVADADHQTVLDCIHQCMLERFGIEHVTFQLERHAMYAREHEHLAHTS